MGCEKSIYKHRQSENVVMGKGEHESNLNIGTSRVHENNINTPVPDFHPRAEHEVIPLLSVGRNTHSIIGGNRGPGACQGHSTLAPLCSDPFSLDTSPTSHKTDRSS